MLRIFRIDVVNPFCYHHNMLKIRLQRFGKRNQPHFRVVLTESTRGPRSRNYIEALGWYDPAAGVVNLERALAVSDRLGGHIVQGHVDGTGRFISTKVEGDSTIVRVRAPKRLMPYIVEKGFIAVDGISLTVVKRGASSFTLAVIPYTLGNTNLAALSVGDRVNLEADVLAKYVESLLDR